jgi:hypothetical protein
MLESDGAAWSSAYQDDPGEGHGAPHWSSPAAGAGAGAMLLCALGHAVCSASRAGEMVDEL